MILILSSSVSDVLAMTVSSTDQTTSTDIFKRANIFIPKTRSHYGKQYSRNWMASTFPILKIRNCFVMLQFFVFESICVPTEELKATETTTWNKKYVPISVSISSNLQADPIFLREIGSKTSNNCFCFQVGTSG